MAQYCAALIYGFLPDIDDPPIFGEIGRGYTNGAGHSIQFLKDFIDGQFLLGYVLRVTEEWFPRPLDPGLELR